LRFSLDHARAKDKRTGKALSDFFLEEVLADPMVRLAMEADGVSEAHLRHLYSGCGTPDLDQNVPALTTTTQRNLDVASIRAAENEGMPSISETLSRSLGRRVAGYT